MPHLDMRTVFACYLLLTAVCASVMTLQWRRYRSRYGGLGRWALGYAFQLPGLALIALRDSVPELLSIAAGNALIVLGLTILLMGMRSFLGAGGRAWIDFAAIGLFAAAQACFTVWRPDVGARIVLFSLAMLFVCCRGILMIARLERGLRSVSRGVAFVLALFALASAARIALALIDSPRDDLFDGGFFDPAILIAYMALYAALTFSLISLIGRRVFSDQESLLAEKAEAETALAESEEKFSKAFRASPDAIMISRLRDGRIVEVNEGFRRLTGYSREESLGDPPIDLWGGGEKWLDLVSEARRHALVADREVVIRGKSGAELRAGYSGGLIDLGGERHIVSILRDLSEKDRADRIILVRLELREYAIGHTTTELMVKALDEIEGMTESRIGFYHFVDEAKGTLSLQAWSTRTSRDFCKAEGKGMHYPVESAGVWADALRARRPIIHNDYESLPGRKGLPEGHAAVGRELVVPTFREGKVVAILGVGNKPGDYGPADITLVSYVADLVWTIVEQKRTEERVLELNERLSTLALIDDLTGIPNRRAFFALAEREFAKSDRYSTPLSFLMIDIDHFKLVNDTQGHAAGDAVLRTVAEVLTAQVRDVDVAARLGGEEFGVLMPSTHLSDALASAERLRTAIARASCSFAGLDLRVTVSIGVSTRNDGFPDLNAIMKAADQALYRAKEGGRDRVEAM